MSSALIVNPASGKSRGKGLALAAMLRGTPGVTVCILDEFGSLESHLDSLARSNAHTLFISSGDGTIQAIQTVLAERKPLPVLPRLALLPHGTTNMTAADLGLRRRGLEALAAFIRNPAPQLIERRPTLRVANPHDGHPRHGMFLGAGAVARAAAFCQKAIHRAGLKGDAATFATLAAVIAKSLLSRRANEDRFNRAYPMTVSRGANVMVQGGQLMLLASTLRKLILGSNPFWGGADSPMRVSVLPFPAPSLTRWLIPLMYGGENRSVPTGAVSFSANTFEIETTSSFIIDGEFFEPPPSGPLRIELGPVFDYIRD